MRFVYDNQPMESLAADGRGCASLARALYTRMESMMPGEVLAFAADFDPIDPDHEPCDWYGIYCLDKDPMDFGRAWIVSWFGGNGIGFTSDGSSYDNETAIDILRQFLEGHDIYELALEVKRR